MKNYTWEYIQKYPKQTKRLLGIDEIALVKGQKNYCAVLVNLDTGKLIAILEKRTQEELRETLTGWGKELFGLFEGTLEGEGLFLLTNLIYRQETLEAIKIMLQALR